MNSTKIDWHLWKPRYSRGQIKIFLWILVFLALAVITYETIEHRPSFLTNIDSLYIAEAVVLGLGFPLLFGGILIQWLRARSEKFQLARLLSLRSEFNRRLSQVRSWEELADMLAHFPAKVAPLVGGSLMVYNPNFQDFETAAGWSDEPDEPVSQHWLPLAYQEQLVAVLVLSYLSASRLSMAELSFFKDISTEMALAVKLMHPALNNKALADTFVAVDRRLARDLHDSLAQNLAFIRLKLDHLSGDGNGSEIQLMQQDLQALRQSAAQAYDQVRGKLHVLHPHDGGDLEAALSQVAQNTGWQSRVDIQFRSEGLPRNLPEQVSHNIVAIVQEALVNAGKHSQADIVEVRLIWVKDGLFVKVYDNGIGFRPDRVGGNGHMGFDLMMERARAIQAQLEVESLPGTGTEITLRIAFPNGENEPLDNGIPLNIPSERWMHR
jgi:signal transduction histidine kinase